MLVVVMARGGLEQGLSQAAPQEATCDVNESFDRGEGKASMWRC